MIRNLINGFCMALADSVPGVSGVTIAFIMGFYEKLIESIRNLFGFDSVKRVEGFKFLVKLGCGWIIGFASSMIALSRLFESNIYLMSSVFMGLSIAAIPFIVYQEWDVIKNRYLNLIYTVIGFVVVAGVSLSRSIGNFGSVQSGLVDFEVVSVSNVAYLVLAGAIAITAMVVPGISGSTLLLIMGVYVPTLDAIGQLTHLNFSVLPGIVCIACGVLCGIILSIRVIKHFLENHRCQCIYAILGMVLGSLVAIAYGGTTLNNPVPPMGIDHINWLGMAIGIVIILLFEMMGMKAEKHHEKVNELEDNE